MSKNRPLEPAQQVILAKVRDARIALDAARRNRKTEIDRRINLVLSSITADVDDEINALDLTLDNLMIQAVESGVSIRKIATLAMGATHDGSVRRMIHEAMADRRREEQDQERVERGGSPLAVLAGEMAPVSGNSTIADPDDLPVTGGTRFTLDQVEHVLYEDANERIVVATVIVELDPLDPWISTMRDLGRKGSEHLTATTCTIYRNPGDGKMIALESREPGDTFYDHLAARWVKDHQDDASRGYDQAIAGASRSADA